MLHHETLKLFCRPTLYHRFTSPGAGFGSLDCSRVPVWHEYGTTESYNKINTRFTITTIMTCTLITTTIIIVISSVLVEATDNLLATAPCACTQRLHIEECEYVCNTNTHTCRLECSHMLPLTDTYQRDKHKQARC